MATNLDFVFNRRLNHAAGMLIEQYQELLASGCCRDFEHYKEMVGFCGGVRACLDEAERIRKEMVGAT